MVAQAGCCSVHGTSFAGGFCAGRGPRCAPGAAGARPRGTPAGGGGRYEGGRYAGGRAAGVLAVGVLAVGVLAGGFLIEVAPAVVDFRAASGLFAAACGALDGGAACGAMRRGGAA